MNYFKERIENPLNEKMPDTRFVNPSFDQRAMEMLEKYVNEIIKNDQIRNRIDQNKKALL